MSTDHSSPLDHPCDAKKSSQNCILLPALFLTSRTLSVGCYHVSLFDKHCAFTALAPLYSDKHDTVVQHAIRSWRLRRQHHHRRLGERRAEEQQLPPARPQLHCGRGRAALRCVARALGWWCCGQRRLDTRLDTRLDQRLDTRLNEDAGTTLDQRLNGVTASACSASSSSSDDGDVVLGACGRRVQRRRRSHRRATLAAVPPVALVAAAVGGRALQ